MNFCQNLYTFSVALNANVRQMDELKLFLTFFFGNRQHILIYVCSLDVSVRYMWWWYGQLCAVMLSTCGPFQTCMIHSIQCRIKDLLWDYHPTSSIAKMHRQSVENDRIYCCFEPYSNTEISANKMVLYFSVFYFISVFPFFSNSFSVQIYDIIKCIYQDLIRFQFPVFRRWWTRENWFMNI